MDDPNLASALHALTDYIDAELAPLHRLAEELRGLIEAAGGDPLPESALTPVVDPIKTSLARGVALVGLGYSAGRGILRDNDDYLLWFQKDAAGCRRLVLNLDADDVDFYDYHDTEWFSGARELGRPSIYGPYLDYAGSNRLVYTFAVPVVAQRGFVGVAGGDLDVAVVESRFADVMGQLDRPAVAMTRDRVVITEVRSPWMPGERVPLGALGDGGWRSCGSIGDWTGWRLVAGPSHDAAST